MEIWSCNSSGTLRAAPNIDCDFSSGSYLRLIIPSILLFALYGVAFPAAMLRGERIRRGTYSQVFRDGSAWWVNAVNLHKWSAVALLQLAQRGAAALAEHRDCNGGDGAPPAVVATVTVAPSCTDAEQPTVTAAAYDGGDHDGAPRCHTTMAIAHSTNRSPRLRPTMMTRQN